MIEKTTPTQMMSMGETYTTLPNPSLHAISDPITLAIWVFLISKPRDWSINQTNVCQRFGISARQYYRSMKTLRTLDLCRDYTRRVQNKLQGKTIVVVSSVHDWTQVNMRLNEMGKVQGIAFSYDTKAMPDKASPDLDTSAKVEPVGTSQKSNTRAAEESKKVPHINKAVKQKTEILRITDESSAAVSSFEANLVEPFIEGQLTQGQRACVTQMVSEIKKAKPDKAISVDVVVSLLVNPKAFSMARQQFAKKLNTIKKVVMRDNWVCPKVTEKKQQQNSKTRKLQDQVRTLNFEQAGLKQRLNSKAAQINASYRDAMQVTYNDITERLFAAQQKLAQAQEAIQEETE